MIAGAAPARVGGAAVPPRPPGVAGGAAGAGLGGGAAVSLILLYKIPTLVVDYFTIGWGGMWVALACRNPSRAVWWTIAFFILIPAVLICVPNLLIGAIVIRLARDKVSKHLSIYLAVRREKTSDDWPMVRS